MKLDPLTKKLLPIVYLAIFIFSFCFSLSSFAKEWNSGIGSISPQQQYAIDTSIRNAKAREYNLKQQRAIPTGETYEEASRRRDAAHDEYFEVLSY